VALIATSTPMKIIDQPTGLRLRLGACSASASSSAGAGSFRGGSDNAMNRTGDESLGMA
jgi:hypothetical protein